MTVPRTPPPHRSADERHDAGARRSWLLAGFGSLALGGLLAALNAGAGGRQGLRAFLVGTFVACGAGSLHAVVSGAVDTFRGRTAGRSRVVAATVLGVVTLAIPLMLVGLGA